jgi:hypothetical protein
MFDGEQPCCIPLSRSLLQQHLKRADLATAFLLRPLQMLDVCMCLCSLTLCGIQAFCHAVEV